MATDIKGMRVIDASTSRDAAISLISYLSIHKRKSASRGGIGGMRVDECSAKQRVWSSRAGKAERNRRCHPARNTHKKTKIELSMIHPAHNKYRGRF